LFHHPLKNMKSPNLFSSAYASAIRSISFDSSVTASSSSKSSRLVGSNGNARNFHSHLLTFKYRKRTLSLDVHQNIDQSANSLIVASPTKSKAADFDQHQHPRQPIDFSFSGHPYQLILCIRSIPLSLLFACRPSSFQCKNDEIV
jgi:hypothetical protein